VFLFCVGSLNSLKSWVIMPHTVKEHSLSSYNLMLCCNDMSYSLGLWFPVHDADQPVFAGGSCRPAVHPRGGVQAGAALHGGAGGRHTGWQ